MRRKPEAFCTTVLIVINVAVFLILSMLGDTEDAAFMLQHGAMYEPFITEGQEYYRIFTCMFLHFGITHLMNNMVMLGALGWNLELEIGKLRFIIIYFLFIFCNRYCSLRSQQPLIVILMRLICKISLHLLRRHLLRDIS